jgi:V/A-type H+-transporting ATPase subunit E
MVDTIETFVARLQQDGIQAGQAQADKLRAEAQKQAQQIIDDANIQAKKIIADAQSQGESIVARSKTELQLAARDTIAQLRQTLSDALNAVIAAGAKTTLSDLDFLGKALHEIVTLYAKANMERKLHIDINVPGEIRDDLRDWALSELGKEAVAELRPSLDLRGKLRQVGFEYSVENEGTVEVTLDSVVETLSQLVTPALREILEKATTKK